MTTPTERACLLSYALTTAPAPLTAGPAGPAPGEQNEPAFAELALVVSNSGTEPVRCARIALVLPVGTLAQDLTENGGSIAPAVEPAGAWTVVPVQSDVLVAVPKADTALFPAAGDTRARGTGDAGSARFEVTPRDGTTAVVTTDGLCLTLRDLMVSPRAGVAGIEIEEWSSPGDEALPDTPATLRLDVPKFPFRPGTPDPGTGRALAAFTAQGGPPATEVPAGTPVRLEWNHLRGDTHELYAHGQRLGDGPEQQEQIAGGSAFDLPGGLTRDTAFALKTVLPTPDGGSVAGWDHLTVCVTDQTLETLTVEGDTAVGGDLVIGRDMRVTGDLDATGDIATDAHFLDPTGKPPWRGAPATD